jgi:hypothetical protein
MGNLWKILKLNRQDKTIVLTPIITNTANTICYKLDSETKMYFFKMYKDHRSDSLLYEYYVGLVINMISEKYPFFSKTVKLYQLNKSSILSELQIHSKRCIKNKDAQSISYKSSKYLFTDDVNLGQTNILHCLSLEYIDNAYTFEYYINYNSAKGSNIIEIISIVTLIYIVLYELRDAFTHYDLHFKNIMLKRMPEETILVVKYEDIELRLGHYPLIIDFARSYVNYANTCSKNILNNINAQEDNFHIKRDSNQSFMETSSSNYYVNSANSNKSHDIILLYKLSEYILKYNTNNKSYVKDFKHLVHYIPSPTDFIFGYRESLSNHYNKTSNIMIAKEKLVKIVTDENFKTDCSRIFSKHKNENIVHISKL